MSSVIVQQLKLAVEMLSWSHAQLLDETAERLRENAHLTAEEPLPTPVDVEISAEPGDSGWLVVLAPGPRLRATGPESKPAGPTLADAMSAASASPEATEAKYFVSAIAKRAQTLKSVVVSILDADERLSFEEIGELAGVHSSTVRSVVDGRCVQLADATVELATRIR